MHSYTNMKAINLFQNHLRYISQEVKFFCPHCGARVEAIVRIMIDDSVELEPIDFIAKVCKCGHLPTLDEILQALEDVDYEE